MIPSRRGRGGLTLVEILVALSLLLLGAVTALGTFPTVARLGGTSREGTTRLYQAQDKMEELLQANTFIGTSYASDEPETGVARRWRGQPDPYNNLAMQVIEVEVSWVERGVSRNIRLTGQVAP